MDADEALSRLRLFNEKADKLRRSRFMQHIIDTGKISISMSAGMGKPLEFTAEGPDEDNIDAFITTYRFFIQQRDKIDLAHMKQVYQYLQNESAVSCEKVAAAIQAIDSADDYFSGSAGFVIDGETISRQKLHDVIIYGGIAHANPDKKATYSVWESSPYFPLLSTGFTSVLLDVIRTIFSFVSLNNEAIAYLEKEKATSSGQ